jgi:membrane-associated phospholipid phosphatase
VRAAAKIISIIFHPLLLTTYLVVILTLFFPSMLMIKPEWRNMIIGLIFVFTFVLPALNILTMRYFGNVTSLTLYSRQQRIVPFFFISLLYMLVTFLFYYKLPFSQNFNKLMVIITAMVVISLVITFFFKISIHSLAASGGIGILLPLNKATEEATLLLPTAFVIVAAGLVMSSRLLLDAHTPREVLYGGIVGFLVGFGGMVVLF